MRPTRPGDIGEIEFVEGKLWVCCGGTDWVDRIEREEPPKEMWPYLTTKVETPKAEKLSSRLGRTLRVLRGRTA